VQTIARAAANGGQLLQAPPPTQPTWPALSGGFSVLLTPAEREMHQQVQNQLVAMQLLLRGGGGLLQQQPQLE
jgi:hypothetical protein